MDDTVNDVIVPYWTTRKAKWLLEVWSNETHSYVSLHLESKGQYFRRYGDTLPRRIAYALLRDLRDAQKLLTWSPQNRLVWFFLRSPTLFRQCPDYALRLWDPHGNQYGSVTIHPALVKHRWILRLTRSDARLFVDDLAAAVAIAERLEKGSLP